MAAHIGRQLAITILLLALGGVFLSTLRPIPEFLVPIIFAISMAAFVIALISTEASLFFLGIALCVAPILQAGALNVIVICLLLGGAVRELFRTPVPDFENTNDIVALGLLLLALAYLSSGFGTLFREFDLLLLRPIFDAGGIKGLHAYLAINREAWHWALVSMAGICTAAILTIKLVGGARRGQRFDALICGLAFGCFAAGIFGLLQLTDIHSMLQFGRIPFFVSVNRFNSSFSDPNALGLFATLAIPVLFFIGRGIYSFFFRLSALVLFLFVPWSGSRTFWLGLLVWFGAFAIRAIKEKRPSRWRYLVGSVLISLFVLALSFEPVNQQFRQTFNAPGLHRLLKTVQPDEVANMLFSRSLYTKLAVGTWQRRPIAGVGLDRFYDEQQNTADKLGLKLGGWRDNANNFYLHILAEMGAIGFLLVLGAFYLFVAALRPSTARDNPFAVRSQGKHGVLVPPAERLFLIKSALGVLALVLLTGPHLVFDEVRYLAAVLLAFGVSQLVNGEEHRRLRDLTLILVIVVPLAYPLAIIKNHERPESGGFYYFEQSETEGLIRWSTGRAWLRLCGVPAGTLSVGVQLQHPDLSKQPVKLLFKSWEEQAQKEIILSETEFNSAGWRELRLPQLPQGRSEKALLILEVDRVWTPLGEDGHGDSRWLGARLRWPETACEQP